MTKTFLLGTGCQKGGTSWLFHYLRDSPQYARGFRKEYHVFDAIDIPSQAYRRLEVADAAERTLTRAHKGRSVNAQIMLLAAMQANPTFYYDYFAGLLTTRREARVTADVTPAYGMLSSGRLDEIRTEFAARGIRTVSIFLMRDPVDRVLSQIRMQVRRKADRFGAPLHEVLLQRHDKPAYASRTRYDHTLAVLDEAFEPDELHFAFYESFFHQDRVREVCDFLGIDFHPPKLDVRKNASPPADDVPETTLRTVAETFRPVYEAVAARFPEVDLPELWPYARLLG